MVFGFHLETKGHVGRQGYEGVLGKLNFGSRVKGRTHRFAPTVFHFVTDNHFN
jgi:hypothetical protein